MWNHFFLENIHFAIYVFAALVMFATSWLYFDAWKQRKSVTDIPKIGGFFLLSFSYLLHSVTVESAILSSPILHPAVLSGLLLITKTVAYILLILGLLTDPIQKHPTLYAIGPIIVPFMGIQSILQLGFPILASLVGLLYLRRSTIGLERHLKPIAISFFLLALSEVIGLSVLFRQSSIVSIFEAVAPYGPIWIVQIFLVLCSALYIGRWVFGYLLKQFETQIFMFLTLITLVIFLVTTMVFTSLLVRNIEKESLSQISTDVLVLNYALEGKKKELLASALLTSRDSHVIEAVKSRSKNSLLPLVQETLVSQDQNMLVVTDSAGSVLVRAEDTNRASDSLSDDPLVRRALRGEKVTSVRMTHGVTAPNISIMAAVPVYSGSAVVGSVLTGVMVDDAFIQEVKNSTGLDSTIFGNASVSATTITIAGNNIGLELKRQDILRTVLTEGTPFSGAVTIANTDYFGAFLPLKDIDGVPVGMLFVSRPQSAVLTTAGDSIAATFLVTILLLIAVLIPARTISGYLSRQI